MIFIIRRGGRKPFYSDFSGVLGQGIERNRRNNDENEQNINKKNHKGLLNTSHKILTESADKLIDLIKGFEAENPDLIGECVSKCVGAVFESELFKNEFLEILSSVQGKLKKCVVDDIKCLFPNYGDRDDFNSKSAEKIFCEIKAKMECCVEREKFEKSIKEMFDCVLHRYRNGGVYYGMAVVLNVIENAIENEDVFEGRQVDEAVRVLRFLKGFR